MKTSYKISYKNNSITYYKEGQGDIIFFIHGLGVNAKIWQPITQLLKHNFTCIGIDLPGSGASDYINDLDMIDYANIVKSIIKQQKNTNKIHLIGHSFGGYISLLFAQLFPNQIKSLTLFHSTAYADNDAKKETRKQVINIVQTKKDCTFFYDNLVVNQFSNSNKKSMQPLIKTILTDTYTTTYKALIQYQQAMLNRHSYENFLKDTEHQILFIQGAEDTFISKEDTIQQALLCKKASIKILYNSAHIGMLEEVKNSATIIFDFLNLI